MPQMRNKFLERLLGTALLVAATSVAAAQTTDLGAYQGPGIISPGVGDLGTRSGEQVDLRYYAGISGVVDTNLQPFVLDAQGNLLRIHNLYGIEVDGGVYGVHSWKRSQLAVDYLGSYHRYINEDVFNSSDQTLTLGYTRQQSRHLAFDLRESAGTVSIGYQPTFQCRGQRSEYFFHSHHAFIRRPHQLHPVIGIRNLDAIRAHVLQRRWIGLSPGS